MTSDPKPRIVSLVPSWTETLICAGVHVVGRTRYCIHPSDEVSSIPIVGGTKQVDTAMLAQVKPDLIVLDREENPRTLTEQFPAPWIASHITSVSDVEGELRTFHERIASLELTAMADRWRCVCANLAGRTENPDWLHLPGVIDWIRKPGPGVDRFLYLVWREPWRAAGPDTFIGSVFDLLGFGSRMVPVKERYPEIDLAGYDPDRTLLLFSTEPYPFHREKGMIRDLPFASALVDGEAYSWFGVRTLRFLESCASE